MPIDAKGLLAKVQANLRTLDACPGHDFQRTGDRPLLSRYRCAVCGGEVDGQYAAGYQRGLEHACATK